VFANIGADTVELLLTGKPAKAKYKASYRTTTRGSFDVIITAVDASQNASQAAAARLNVR
jgi:hypothetical protein